MRKLGILAAAAGFMMLVAACGSSTSSSSPSSVSGNILSSTSATTGAGTTAVTSAATTAAAPNLSAELLTVHDMPTGWSVDNSPTNPSSTPECFKQFANVPKTIADADAKFQGGTNRAPLFEEKLGFEASGVAHSNLVLVDQALSGCKQVNIITGGTTFNGGVGALSFPQIGDESTAYQFSFSGDAGHGLHITIGFDLVVFRRGDTLALLSLGDLGTPDVNLLQQLAGKAVAKLTP